MEIAMLVLTVLGVIAAIIAALPPLGVDVRLFGRPNMPLEGIPYFRARQAWIAIAVALISLAVSAGAFYYFFRPRVVEKIVEKPVDRIVEKVVPADCPKPLKTGKAKEKPTADNSVHVGTGASIDQSTQGDCSPNMIGGSNTVNCEAPPLKLMPNPVVVASDQEGLIKTVITVVPNKDVVPPFNVVLKFDIPIKSVGVWIAGSGGLVGGGPAAVSSGTDPVIPLGTGFNPKHPLLLTVYSTAPVTLLGIHLE
jgi:hypothetical protein